MELQHELKHSNLTTSDNSSNDCDKAVADKKRWLEGAFSKKGASPNQKIQISSRELASEKVKWLEEHAFKKEEIKKEPAQPISRNLAAERAKWLQEESNKKLEAKEIEEPSSRELAAGKVKWLEEQAFKKEEIKKEMPNKIGKQKVTQRLDWLQGNKDTQKSPESTPVRNQILSLQGKLQKKTAVQLRKEAFEREQAEIARKNDPKSFMKVNWNSKGVHGQFAKNAVDSRGPVPKKTLADLP